MSKALEKINNQPIYGITEIVLNDGGTQLSRKKCKKIDDESLKTFNFDEQDYRIISSRTDYTIGMNKLSQNYIKLRSFKNKLLKEWKTITGTRNQAKHLEILVKEATISIETLLERVKIFRSVDINRNNYSFIKLIKKYQFENYFVKNLSNIKKDIGVSSKNPAFDCSQIKEIYKTKKSGFYYIQPSCSSIPMRVFCDFSILPQGLSFYIFNNEQLPNTKLDNIKITSVVDIRYHCASKGLYPIEIKNIDTTKRITQLLITYGYDLGSPLIIPLGYDYNCDKGTCINSYNSLNREDSDPILPFLLNSANDNISQEDEHKNTIGLGYDKDGLPYIFNLKNSNVTALICSTNNYENYEDPSVIKISCSDSLLTNSKLDMELNTEIKVNCPSFCSQDTKGLLIGTGTYSGESSICKAAIHSGIIKDIHGGIFIIKISPSKASFLGSTNSGITSRSSKKVSRKSFNLERNKEKCPIDFLKHLYYPTSSFIELENGALNHIQITELEDLQNKYYLEKIDNTKLSDEAFKLTNSPDNSLDNINNLNSIIDRSNKMSTKNVKNPKKESTNESKIPSKSTNKNSGLFANSAKTIENLNKLKEAKKAAKKAAKKVKKASKKAEKKTKKIMKSLKKLKQNLLKKGKKKDKKLKKKKKVILKNLLSSLRNSTKLKKKPKKHIKQTTLINTDKAIKILRTQKKEETKELTEFINYGTFMNHVINKFNSEISFSRNPSPLSIETLRNNYNYLKVLIKKLGELSSSIQSRSTSRLEYTKNIHSKLQEKYQSLDQSEEYSLKYKNLNIFWEKFDNKATENGPSNVRINTNSSGTLLKIT